MNQDPEKTKGKYILSNGPYEKEDETTEEELAWMEKAYDILCKNEAYVRKAPMSKIVTLNERKSGLSFVIPNFKCRAFHVLHKNENRIYGPLAIIQSFDKIQRLLRVNFPLLSLNMYGTYLTFTGLNKEEKNILAMKCQWLGAEYDGNFVEMTTHLIAKECSIQSDKHRVASQRSTPVVMPSWIEEAYEAANNCDKVYSALENVENHFVPIFTNCVISCSDLPPKERFKIAELVENNGGKFTKEMDRLGCTHLIIDSTTGAKYRRAILWGNIHCVRLKWLLECVNLKRRLPENRYPPGQETSTQVESNTTLNDRGLNANVSTTMSTNATLPSEAGLSKRISNDNDFSVAVREDTDDHKENNAEDSSDDSSFLLDSTDTDRSFINGRVSAPVDNDSDSSFLLD
uniref:BRCT domain-containing protein n=1 Tax=Panagrolaimus sp. JU765 TaxID=591449 RepID=A0AC34R6F5_9BILA